MRKLTNFKLAAMVVVSLLFGCSEDSNNPQERLPEITEQDLEFIPYLREVTAGQTKTSEQKYIMEINGQRDTVILREKVERYVLNAKCNSIGFCPGGNDPSQDYETGKFKLSSIDIP